MSGTIERGVQAKARRWQEYTDDHGRKWGATIEIRTGYPTGGQIAPQFVAPWLPSFEFVRCYPAHMGKPWAVEIRYAEGLATRQTALEEWNTNLLLIGQKAHGEAFNPEQPTAFVLKELGPKPEPAEFWQAAMEGNGYLLGLRPYNPDHPGDVLLHTLLHPPVVKAPTVFADSEVFAEPMPAPAGKKVKSA